MRPSLKDLQCLDRLLTDLLQGKVPVFEELGKNAILVDEQFQWDEVPRGWQRVMEDGLQTFTRDSRPDWGGYLKQHRTDTGGDKSDSDSPDDCRYPRSEEPLTATVRGETRMAHLHHQADSTSSLVQNGNSTANQALETLQYHEEHFDTIMIQDQGAKSKRYRKRAKDR